MMILCKIQYENMNLLMAILFCEFQTPQQRLLRAGGRRGGVRDERPGAGVPLRAALPPQRHPGRLRRLLRHARGPDVDADAAVIADGANGTITGGRREPAAEGRRRRGHHGCSDIRNRGHPMTRAHLPAWRAKRALLQCFFLSFFFWSVLIVSQ